MQTKKILFAYLLAALLISTVSSYCMPGKYSDSDGNCQSCPQNCKMCHLDDGNSLNCYACNDGFRVNIHTMACEACPANCQQCTSKDGKCTQCYPNYLYNQDTDRCEEQKRDSNGVVICLKGYFNDAGLCNRCGAFCTECDNYGTCTDCLDGYYLTTYQSMYVSQVQCQICRFPCKTCTSGSDCLQKYDIADDLYEDVSGRGKCDSREFQSTKDGSCNSCGANCTDCNKYGVCLGCDDGYNLVNGSKEFAFPFCEACGPTDDCAEDAMKEAEKKCGQSHFYSSSTGKCIQCGYGCLHCTQQGYCMECKDGLYLDDKYEFCNDKPYTQSSCPIGSYKEYATGICTKCKEGCKQCRQWNICESCQSGFHLVERDNTCVNITEYEAEQNVVKCYVGYYPKGKGCEYCGDGCLVCNENMGCMACQNGLNLKNGNCVKQKIDQESQTTVLCASHCVSCSSPFTCDVCQSGFYLFSQGCLACNYGCTQCNSDGSCTGTDPKEEQQDPCTPNCKYCYASGDCVVCQDGYYVSVQDSKCYRSNPGCPSGQYFNFDNQRCESCSANCQECSSYNTCQTCKSGYYVSVQDSKCYRSNPGCSSGQFFNFDNERCESCAANCQECSSYNTCQTCKSGYYLPLLGSTCKSLQSSCSSNQYYNSVSKSCQYCPQNCQSCSDSNTCFACKQTYTLSNDGSCFIKSCPPGTYFTGSSCQTCDDNCLECSNGGKCSLCADGFYLKDSECKHCGADCRTCDVNEKCTNVDSYETSCPEGQFRNSFNMCFNCPYDCKHCGEMYTCIQCKDGYYKNSLGTCSQCIGCSTCSEGGVCPSSSSTTDYSTIVSPCGHGRYMATWGSCMNCGWGCDYCDQMGTCKRCQTGYYSSYNFCYKCNYPCATCSSASQCLTTLSSLDWADENPKAHLALMIFGIASITAGLGYLAYFMYSKKAKQGEGALLENQNIQMSTSIGEM